MKAGLQEVHRYPTDGVPYCSVCYQQLPSKDGVAKPHDLRDCLVRQLDDLAHNERKLREILCALGAESLQAFRELERAKKALNKVRESTERSPDGPETQTATGAR